MTSCSFHTNIRCPSVSISPIQKILLECRSSHGTTLMSGAPRAARGHAHHVAATRPSPFDARFANHGFSGAPAATQPPRPSKFHCGAHDGPSSAPQSPVPCRFSGQAESRALIAPHGMSGNCCSMWCPGETCMPRVPAERAAAPWPRPIARTTVWVVGLFGLGWCLRP